MQQRSVDPEPAAFDAGTRGQRGEALECFEVLGAAIGIAGVIERVRADGDVACIEHFRPRQRERQKDGVSRGDVRGRDDGGVDGAIFRHGGVVGQGRPADRRQVHSNLQVLPHAQGTRDPPGRLDLTRVALAVQTLSAQTSKPSRCRTAAAVYESRPPLSRTTALGIRSPAVDRPRMRPHTPRVSGVQMYLCTCSCTRTGRQSASTHSASVRASRTPCTGENSTAVTRSASAWRTSTSRAYS